LNIFKSIRDRINRLFRIYYENRISLPYGMARFMSNVAFIQLNAREFVELAPCNGFGNPWVTVSGMRPLINYSVFVDGSSRMGDWMPMQAIVESRGVQVRAQGSDDTAWELVKFDDPRVAPLKDMFLGFAFYAPLLASHKKPLEEKASAQG
jgi:hypothetical protein